MVDREGLIVNKYLEKIANKVELEPGVHYDLKKHDVVVSRGRMSDYVDSRDRVQRGVVAATYGTMAGAFGGALGARHAQYHLLAPGTSAIHKLSQRLGRGRAIRAVGVAAGAGSAVLGGGLAYASGGVSDYDKPGVRNKYMQHLEKKHSSTIHKLEGWD